MNHRQSRESCPSSHVAVFVRIAHQHLDNGGGGLGFNERFFLCPADAGWGP
jgi:hypothetical protein